MRKIFFMLLVCIAFYALPIHATAAGPDTRPGSVAREARSGPVFVDVPENAWYYNDVYAAVRQGLINGKSATQFAPDDNLTQAEAVALAARYQQLLVAGEITIPSGDPWYLPSLEYADEHFLGGQNVWAWSPEVAAQPITRNYFVSIFYLMLPDSEYEPINTIPDGSIPDAPMSDPYSTGIYTLYRAGIVAGSGGERFFIPMSNIKRAEVAAILARITNTSSRVKFEMDTNGTERSGLFAEPQLYADFLLGKIPKARDMVNRGMSIFIEDDMVTINSSDCIRITLGTDREGRFVSELFYAVSPEWEIFEYDVEEDFWWSMGNIINMP